MARFSSQALAIVLSISSLMGYNAFVVSPHSSPFLQQQQQYQRNDMFLRAAETSTNEDVASMRAGEIKKELESYGISTKSFLEKSELVDALIKARADGLKPKSQPSPSSYASSTSSSTASSSSSSSTASSSSSTSTSAPKDPVAREQQIVNEMIKLQSMKASEMKKELEERGISTKSFFEKSEFVKALAEARVDNVTKKSSTGGADGSVDEEGYAEYKNVEVLTDDASGPRKRSSEQAGGGRGGPGGAGSPFGGAAGANPFGGAAGANPFGGAGGMGGMGGMGNIADLLKNMGGGAAGAGAAGANPFGGAAGGANPFGGMGGMGGMGDAMGKAQEMMKNPKVMALMQKAQSNPKFMKAMTECMSNPAAFAKYQNDPEIGSLIKELQQYM